MFSAAQGKFGAQRLCFTAGTTAKSGKFRTFGAQCGFTRGREWLIRAFCRDMDIEFYEWN